MKYAWNIAAPRPDESSRLAAAAGVSELLAQCLVNRGVTLETAAEFLRPRLQSLSDPFLIPNMAAAVDRLLTARERGEAIVIFGDYDVDGVSATALLLETLGPLGWKLSHYLPSRLDEGYGLTLDAVKTCVARHKPALLLAVDCGSTAVETVAWLIAAGLDVIILDHHQVSAPPPAATALVNPRLAAGPPSFVELCSAGLAFKLAHALLKRLRAASVQSAQTLDLRDYLDLAALGTIADIVPVTGENRILIRAGLKKLDATKRPGLVALKTAARTATPITTHDVGFGLGPRLNAAGRLEEAEEALQLLLCREPVAAELTARSLDERNRQRQSIERSVHDAALEATLARFDAGRDFVIVEGHESWHVGVVGIVASRLTQRFHRPSIVFGGDGAAWRGSGRSIDGFDLAAALRDCASLLLRHGGHAMAAGVSMEAARIDEFRQRLNSLARDLLQPEQLRPRLELDAIVPLAELTVARVEELQQIEPCGPGNPPVRLAVLAVEHQQPPQRMGKEKQHAKLRLTDGGAVVETVWWNCGETPLPEARFDIAFTPTLNDFQGRRTVVLKLLDWKPCA